MTAPANRIAEMRKQVGLTQQALAEKLGIHWVTVSKIERGARKLSFERCKEIADVLGVPEASLRGDPSDHSNERIRALEDICSSMEQALALLFRQNDRLKKRVTELEKKQ